MKEKPTDPNMPDIDELLSRKNEIKQNDLGIENAISSKDLDMALYYLLD